MPRIVKKVIKLLYPHKVGVCKDLENLFMKARAPVTAIDQRNRFYSGASAPPEDDGFLSYNFTQNNHVHPTAPPLQIEVVTDELIYNVD